MAELSLSSGRTSPSTTQYASLLDSLASDFSGVNHPREMFIPQHQLLSLTDQLHPSQPADVSNAQTLKQFVLKIVYLYSTIRTTD